MQSFRALLIFLHQKNKPLAVADKSRRKIHRLNPRRGGVRFDFFMTIGRADAQRDAAVKFVFHFQFVLDGADAVTFFEEIFGEKF